MRFFYIFVLALVFSYELTAQHPAADTNDSLALVALYNATNGPEWENDTNWLVDSVYKWYGITLDVDGKVVKIVLENNSLSGSIPPEIGNLDQLTYLYLNVNQLSGSIPSEIGDLDNLITIFLNHNQLNGSIPPEIGSMQNLYELGLYHNQLSGDIPGGIGDLPSIAYLDLSENQLTGTIPPELGNLTNLVRLNLSNNQLSGNIPPELGNLIKLQSLDLYNNNLTGSIPPELDNMKALLGIQLFHNQLTGAIPPEIGNLEKLTTLSLSENKLAGNIPAEIGNLKNLEYLSLYLNNLSGPIPPEIGELTNLISIVMSYNQLSGNLPREIGNLTNLEKLRLDFNQLEGALPEEITNLTNLSYCTMQGNRFDSLPDLSALTNLNYFNVVNNYLTFEDIEPNIGLPQFLYSGQARIGTIQHIHPDEGEEVTLSFTTGGTANTYQWYKDNSPVSGATDSTFIISSYHAADDTGTYHCEVRNTIATELTLFTQNYYVGVDVATFSISVSTDPADGGTITGSGTYQDGDTVILKAVANTGYEFESWNEFGSPVSRDTSYRFIVSEDRTLVAIFSQITGIRPPTPKAEITIFPNPSDGHFTIRTESNIEKIIFYNLMGEKVSEKTYRQQIDISWLRNGIYFARFLDKNDSTLKVSKLIIRH